MHDDLEDAMKRLRIDEHTFFRIAHQWAFGKMPDLHREVLEYKVCGIIPPYVTRYLSHIGKEQDHAVQKVS